ncbi:MAG: magnesium chelatase domain-containing protein, partial [Pseudomonadota bacterium]
MSIATVSTRAIIDINARAVTVEVHLVAGLPSFSIVGLPEAAVRESRDRVRSAIINSGFEFPRKRITVNLAPADLPKVGAGFDLAIAVGVLVASGTLESHLIDKMVFLGELALNGGCRPVRGALIAALSTKTS